MIRIRLQIEIPGDELTIDLAPRLLKLGVGTAVVAEREMDRAVADARAWLAARVPRPTAVEESR